MACDAGALTPGNLVVSMGGTYKGLDTAIVARASYTYDFLRRFEVLEIIAKPWSGKQVFKNGVDEGWKGDIDEYYREPCVPES